MSAFASFTVLSITVRVFNPRKSNLISPVFSVNFMSYCVSTSPLGPLHNGKYSTMGSGEITTPAAWVEVWRGSPSSTRAIDSSSSIRGSRFAASLSRGSCSRASFKVILSWSGTSFAIRSTSPYGMARALPTSLNTPRAFMEPKVTIWATCSAPPYLSCT